MQTIKNYDGPSTPQEPESRIESHLAKIEEHLRWGRWVVTVFVLVPFYLALAAGIIYFFTRE